MQLFAVSLKINKTALAMFLVSAKLVPIGCLNTNTKYQLTWNRFLLGTELYEADAPVKVRNLAIKKRISSGLVKILRNL